jgi:hypothetical protein
VCRRFPARGAVHDGRRRADPGPGARTSLKKIWATEYGQPSSEFSEANQAAYIGDFLRTWRTLDYAGPAFIHTLADYPSSDPIAASFGLFHQDWTPKPALAVVEQVIVENEAIEATANDDVL